MPQQNIFLKMDTGVHTSGIKSLKTTSDGSYLVSSGFDKTIRVWDPITQKETRKILGQINEGDQGDIHNFVLTCDDRYLISQAIRNKNGKSNDTIRIYDFESGSLLKTLDSGTLISSIDITRDNKYIAFADYNNCEIFIWDFETFLEMPVWDPSRCQKTTKFDWPNQPGVIKFFQQGNDYRLVINTWNWYSGRHMIALYSLNQDRLIADPIILVDNTPESTAINDQYICIQNGAKPQISIYDYDLNFIAVKTCDTHPVSLTFSPNGRYLLAGYKGTSGYCAIYDAQNDFELATKFTVYQDGAAAAVFLNNSTAVTGGGTLNEIHLWDPKTGQVRGHIPGIGQSIFAVGITGHQIAFGNTQAYKPDQNNFAPLQRAIDMDDLFIDHLAAAEIPAFNRVTPQRDNIHLEIDTFQTQNWDLLLNRSTRLTGSGNVGWRYAEAFTVTEDKLIIAAMRGGKIFAISPDGIYLAYFRGHNSQVWDLAVDGRLLVSGGIDQIIRVWNLDEIPDQTPKNLNQYRNRTPEEARPIDPLLNIFITKDDEWIIWSKSGYYNASLRGDRYIGFHVNQGQDKEALFYPSDRFIDALYRPDVISEILKTGRESEALKNLRLDHINIENILPPVIHSDHDPFDVVEESTFPLEFTIVPAENQAVERISISCNGQPLMQLTGLNIVDPQKIKPDPLPLLPGKNEIHIIAYSELSRSMPLVLTINRTGVELVSRDVTSNNPNDPQHIVEIKPNLYILAVGVAHYKFNDQYLTNLSSPATDVDKLVTELKKQKGRAFEKVISLALKDGEATNENILDKLKVLQTAVQARQKEKKSKNQFARDVVIVILAGHGYKVENSFYFLTHHTKSADIAGTALPINKIGDILNEIPAELVLLTDACHAGAAGNYLFNSNEFVKRWVAEYDRAQVIFNATTAANQSYEFGGYGAFAKGILDELRESKQVTIMKLFHQVSNRVRIGTESIARKENKPVQTPTLTIYGSLKDFILYK